MSHKTDTPLSNRPEPTAAQVADSVAKGPDQQLPETISISRPVLDPFRVSALREFFQLLDKWDRAGASK